MKKHITIATFIAAMAVLYSGCNEDKNNTSPVTTMRTTVFDGAQSNCMNGGVKIEVLVDGTVDDAQTQYLCNGVDGQNSQDGHNGHNVLVLTTDEVGTNCESGGIRVDEGLDENDNGVLDDAEILNTRYVCNGANGEDGTNGATAKILTTAFDDAQGNCTNGGIRIDDGLDTNGSGDLDADEILNTRYVCNGTDGQNGANGVNTSIRTTAFEDAQGDCANGGVKVEVLIGDVVQAEQTQYVCNGANGVNGQDGQNGQDGDDGQNGQNALVTTSNEVASANCANGGMRIDIGLDANNNGTLDASEILSTRYVCNGENGINGLDGQDGQDGEDGHDGTNGKNATIQTTSFTGSQGGCTNGGTKIEVLLDGVVQTAQTRYICNGVNGQDGTDGQDGTNGKNATIQTTSFNGAQNGCTNGGTKIEVLLDGVVQTAQTRYICNGVNGQDGQDGQDGHDGTNGKNATIQTTSFSGAQGGCTNGGTKIEVLLDGVVQSAQTRYICNGVNGQDGQDGEDGHDGTNGKNATIQTTSFSGSQGGCTNGGTKIEVLLDGVVQSAQTRYICNGVNGQDGQDGEDGHDGTNGKNATIQTTSFSGSQGGCTNGGTKIEVLLDGVVQSAQTRYICNGVNGQDGQDGEDGHDGTNGKNATIQTTSFSGAQGGCTNGGIKLEVLLDGVVQTGQTQYICNGASGGGNPCVVGKWFDGDACRPDDAEHCRGVDCTTAIAHWSDGICTESGQCQVTGCTGDTHLYDDGSSTICEANTSEHCGSHTTNCGEGSECVNGACSGGIIQDCGDGLTDLLTDIDNCGACGNACVFGLNCISGRCLGNANCNGETHDTKTDLDHCGECDHRCDDGTTCVLGECVVAPGPAYCGTQTVQLNTLRHCASCDACADGLLCQNNQCVEGQGQMICNNVIIDSRTDSANCGSCGNVCNAGFECVNSSCKRISDFSSTTTLTCNAQSVTPYTDVLNCAGCGIACATGYNCKEGACMLVKTVSLASAMPGDFISFGHYEQDNNTSNGKEPIIWRVLERNSENQLLVISEKVLDVKPYNTTFISITWEKSTIRSWLNGYASSYNTVGTSFASNNFINTAFTSTEKDKIVASNVPAHANPNYSTSPGNATTDKIFLLSITEANNYFLNNADRKADATQYALKQGVYVYGSTSGKYTSDGTCTDVHCFATWWLRSPGSNTGLAALVNLDGSVLSLGHHVLSGNNGVRPALWIQY